MSDTQLTNETAADAFHEDHTLYAVRAGLDEKVTGQQILEASEAYRKRTPTIFAHRGWSSRAPENTLAAWDLAYACGFGLEGDWAPGADGALIAMHDSTVDRTTTSTGNRSAFTMSQYMAMDAGSDWNATGYTTVTVPTFDQFLDRYPDGFLVPEVSDATQATAMKMAQALAQRNLTSRAILQMFESAPYTVLAAVKAKYPDLTLMVNFATAASAPTLSTIVAAGIEWLGVDIGSSFIDAAWVASVHAAGLKVAFYVVDTAAQLATVESIGYDAIFTNRPGFMARGGTLTTGSVNETFTGDAKWLWGDDWTITNMALPGGAARPFNGSAGTSVTTLTNGAVVCTGRPLPASGESYTIDFSVTLKASNADTSRWCALTLANQSDAACYQFSPCNGSAYAFMIRQTGALEIHKWVNGVNSAQLVVSTTPHSALVVDTPVLLRIAVTPTQLTFTRLDTGKSCTIADATFRGGKLGLHWSNLAVHFGPIATS